MLDDDDGYGGDASIALPFAIAARCKQVLATMSGHLLITKTTEAGLHRGCTASGGGSLRPHLAGLATAAASACSATLASN